MNTRFPASYNCLLAIQRLVLRIKTAANFNNDIVSCSVPILDVENMGNLPHVNLVWGAETYLTADDRSRVLEQEERRSEVLFHIYFREKNNPNLVKTQLVADFERQFDKDRNYLLPDDNGVQTCFNCQWVENNWTPTKQASIYMIEMVLRVWYSTPRGNPYQLV